MIRETVEKIKRKINLSKKEMKQVFDEIMSGGLAKEDIKDFLKSLHDKGESADEIAAAAEVMREKALRVNTKTRDLVDTCGTGGAKIRDINVSTIVAIVLAASGVKVAKHGNRSFTGKCGSADLLEELGVNIHMSPKEVGELIEKAGFGFMFAPDYHPAMKRVSEARKELAMRTIFNIIGPLSNPAGANMQILGVYDARITELMAGALKKLGARRALVVHGLEGLDEISIKGRTKISELKDDRVRTYQVKPDDFGIKEGNLEEVKGGDREYNKKAVLEILKGEDRTGRRDIVLINAGAALNLAGKAKDFKEGVKIAAESINSGKAIKTLEQLRKLSHR